MLLAIYLVIGLVLAMDVVSKEVKGETNRGPAVIALNIVVFVFGWGTVVLWGVFDLFGKGPRELLVAASYFAMTTGLLLYSLDWLQLQFQHPDWTFPWFWRYGPMVAAPVLMLFWVDSILDFGKLGQTVGIKK